ncbi:MAG: hypothetical protein AB7T48_05275 [Solirubrobacterales bacterium]
MGAIRVRWRGVGKVAGLAAAAVVGLNVLPGAFAAPQAPPLAPDVGLAGVAGTSGAPPVIVREAEAEPEPARKRRPKPKPRPSRGVAPASAVIGTTPRRHELEPEARRRCPNGDLASVCEPKSPPAPAPPPPSPAPEPVVPAPPSEPVPVPAPPQPAPEDGSMEFAPH